MSRTVWAIPSVATGEGYVILEGNTPEEAIKTFSSKIPTQFMFWGMSPNSKDNGEIHIREDIIEESFIFGSTKDVFG